MVEHEGSSRKGCVVLLVLVFIEESWKKWRRVRVQTFGRESGGGGCVERRGKSSCSDLRKEESRKEQTEDVARGIEWWSMGYRWMKIYAIKGREYPCRGEWMVEGIWQVVGVLDEGYKKTGKVINIVFRRIHSTKQKIRGGIKKDSDGVTAEEWEKKPRWWTDVYRIHLSLECLKLH